ncbi:dTDP-Rha--alpha-D-GlcNAc-pyrophosphate polyprenol alpha-3-L-rhamnosyltransferase [Marivirga lumbricoides]|uniref:dTDP-Rha--alpha-D-GlcNAc-pyrophosphate polyprenol alpha-3-L-rhamnosyltransferase n=1 Tax=Marivirga lumbricoides TaxID=1046115 RepID=A0A2T4DQJ9_9BACT|nr:dTDP-Rha--alpha-D-GlcNAc-pyrophosphate polyprenol alpha-3-L-rhamnosyltransferase [Marivirga lumbricoides]
MPDQVAVVILNFNGRNYLEQFLPSVIKNSKPHKVIVADNASTDDSVAFLQSQYPDLQLILMEKNTGFAGGYNEALAQINAEYFVLLNSDVEVTPNWIDPVIHLMQEKPEIIACQPKIKSFYKKTHFEYAGAAGGFIDYLGYPFCRGRIFSTLEEDKGQYDDDKEIFWATGACFFVKAKPFFELGALDERFFAHMEEIDFCWRAKNKGYRIYYTAKSTVYHVGGGTLQTDSPYKTYLNFRNNLLMLYKNLSLIEFTPLYKKRKLLDYLAATQFFLQGKAKNCQQVLKAHQDFKKMAQAYNSENTEGLDHPEILKKSLLKEYFLRQKKHFSDLQF